MGGTAAHGNTPPQPPSASLLTLRPTTPDPDNTNGLNSWRVVAPGASWRPPRLVGGWTPTREGADDDRDHPARAGRRRPAARGGAVPGRAGGAADARPGAGAGGGLAGGGGAGGRHGPADPARPGASVQRGGPRRRARPTSIGTQAAAHARAGSGAGGGRGAGAGPRPGRRGALAAGRPPSADRGAVRGPAARALGGQGPAPARLRPPVGQAEAPEGRRGGAGGVQKSFAELVREALPEHARGKPVEVWFQDEARVGQQGTLTRVWARRGTRPRAPRDRRYAWAYLFGAVCPERAVGAALVLPYADAAATGLHLAEIGRHVTPGAHGVVVLDGAGWHAAGGLAVPGNLTLLPLPRYSPELNPVENVWEYLRQNKLSHRVWPDYEAIVATCCEAWNWLVAAPDRLASITRREWAKAVTN